MKQAEEMIKAVGDWIERNLRTVRTESEEKYLQKTGNASKVKNTFSRYSSRTLPASGEALDVTLGKILRYLSDLVTVAFDGEYRNIKHKPLVLKSIINDYGYSNYTEEILYASAAEDRVHIIIGFGGAVSSSGVCNVVDFARAYLIVPKLEAEGVSDGKGRSFIISQLCNSGSKARYSLTAVAAVNEYSNPEKITLKVPAGSWAQVAIYRLYANSAYAG